MMNAQKAGELIEKYNNGTLSSHEKLRLEQWYNNEAAVEKNRLSQKEITELSAKLRAGLPLHYKKFSFRPRLMAAAVAVIILGAGLFYKMKTSESDLQESSRYANDVAPGKQGATLTLANGQKILISELQSGTIAHQLGVKISKNADGQLIYEVTVAGSGGLEYNTLSTSRGEQIQVRLPDGSLVFLNAASSLKYPTSFVKTAIRHVTLTGEAYFEIAKDKAHPFIVESNGQQLEVLGTHFNVNAYPGEAIETTLLEGSLKVSNVLDFKLIRPGERSVALDNGKITVDKADTQLAVAWKNNEFMFHEQNIENIMKMVERWYDVEIIYNMEKTTDTYTGSVSRFDRVSKVLQILEQSGAAHFKIEGRKIYVSK
ncbi:FecR family protein [Pedobacter psychrodurus]|uniref:FecR family protein n=1 Tax=Pedobacter psychrodurus TaxID=2530456 RepID=UPI00292F1A72|nr:FecR domain-containing protein [Pedobacter psychrodurus]